MGGWELVQLSMGEFLFGVGIAGAEFADFASKDTMGASKEWSVRECCLSINGSRR